MIPFAHLSNQLSSSNYPSTLVYNTGNVNLDPNSSRNVAIYNAPGGMVNILSSGSYSCHTCGERFNSRQQKSTMIRISRTVAVSMKCALMIGMRM